MRVVISDVFDYYPGNHGLTEEVIYEFQPDNPDEQVPIYSGSKDNEKPSGYLRDSALNKAGKKVVYFSGPAMILTKDGSAGRISFKESEKFTINHHACVLKLKQNYKQRVDIEWFAYQYSKSLYQYVTSKSDNAVLSTEWLDKLEFNIPDDIEVQKQQRSKKRKLFEIRNRISTIIETLNRLRNSKIAYTSENKDKIGEIFSFKGGNSGLTEELVYYNEPNDEDDSIKIYSGATQAQNSMGVISKSASPDGKKLKLHIGPSLIVTRKGYYAGTIQKVQEKKFVINDDAYTMSLKKEWRDKVNIRWFMYEYQELFYNLVSSRSDNATFNKEYASKIEVTLPDIKTQDKIAELLINIDTCIKKYSNIYEEIGKLAEVELI